MSKRVYWIACTLLFAGLPLDASAQAIAGSCWGNCGEHDPVSGCSCDSHCQVRGDCCANKDTLCFAQAAAPLCPLVNVNTDPAVWGTDLGFSYEHKGQNEILFGDTWSIDTQPLCSGSQLPNDDAMATLPLTRPSWLPTSTTTTPVTCPAPSFKKIDGNSFRPVTLSISGTSMAMPEYVTPGAAWSDGTTAFTWVASRQLLPCDIWNPCPNGTVCHDPWLTPCWPNCAQVCFDPTSPITEFPLLFSHEIAYRPSEAAPTAYVSGHTFYTNKFSYPTTVTVAAFDPDNPANSDYSQGYGTLVVFGRPNAHDPSGRTAPYLAYQHLDSLVPVNGVIDWALQYYAGLDASGDPTWSASEADAEPLSTWEFNFAGFSDVTFVEPLGKWIMLYAGDVLLPPPDPLPNPPPAPVHLADTTQARKGAIHVRMADHPWGPWTPGVPILFRELMANYMGCNATSPPYGTGAWTLDGDAFTLALWQANCETEYRSCGPTSQPTGLVPGVMYAPNVIDSWTYNATGATYPKAAQIYFNVSTGSPYQVVLATARLELPPDNRATFKRVLHLRAYDEDLVANNNGTATTTKQPDNTKTHLELRSFTNPSASGEVRNGSRVLVRSTDGRYLRRSGAHDVGFYSSISAKSEFIVERVLGSGTVQINSDSDIIRLKAVGTERRLKQRTEGLRFYDGTGSTSNFRLTWGCKYDDDCDPAR